jgi:CheY-like chemotaxis protein
MILLLLYSKEEYTNYFTALSEIHTIETRNFSKASGDENWANAITNSINFDNYNEFIIDLHQGSGNTIGLSVLLAGHIILSHPQKNELKIIVTDSIAPDFNNFALAGLPIKNFFQISGINFKLRNDLFGFDELGELKAVKYFRSSNNRLEWKKFDIPFQYDERHQISNEWGALKLALNAGFQIDEINYLPPNTLYFKWLKNRFISVFLTESDRREILVELKAGNLASDKICLKAFLKQRKILLIDDNAEKGWKSVLERIFDCEVDELGSVSNVFTSAGFLNFDPKRYDLIFLDLNLPTSKGLPPSAESGFMMLDKIKESYLACPVILFTASNKSWNAQQAIQKGADGLYIKESPLTIYDKEFSRENLKNFLEVVISCINKKNILQIYWDGILFIQENYVQQINDSEGKLFRSRIDERLLMFFGLLKRGFEERQFNSKYFLFDDYELAFMTLWSLLNEIQEAYYEKRPSEGGTSHNAFGWFIRDQQDIPFLRVEQGGYSEKSSFFYDIKTKIFGFYDNEISTPISYRRTLYIQIAFLLKKKHEFAEDDFIDKYLSDLVNLNRVRNDLYLTHGKDLQSGFFGKTIREKRAKNSINPDKPGKIYLLFSLVHFLLTAKKIRS